MSMAKKLSKAEIRKKILAVLEKTSGKADMRSGKHRCGMVHRTALVLATSYKDHPRATALEFFNEGLTLYILGGPGGKIANIRRNPLVSAFIYEQPMDHRKVQQSLQIFGTAELIAMRNHPRLFRAKLRKWNLDTVMRNLLSPLVRAQRLDGDAADRYVNKMINACSFIKIVPDRIIMKEYYPDFSMKQYEWRATARSDTSLE
ncbi:MAG: pyridoxamine 5'-phosphate oxidase family protein [Desulfobacterota bacterium]|nr:pyridoxamine 5'-phosphate oxidase family protein [Thermodesulfobacteriota bacterium]